MPRAAWPERLLEWYDANRRPMPWRADPTPYRVWISEIMLQQTQVDTVIPYFERFVARFPDIRSLARADLQDVLRAWQGLGYYARARNLHRAAGIVASEMDGRIPGSFEELRKLPGLGPYTAAAIASIAFGEAVPVVDGNVLRVFTRFWGIEDDIRRPRVRDALFDRLGPYVAGAPPSAFNQSIMELGALVCRPTSPDCPRCPIAAPCVARRENRTGELPVKSRAKPIPHHEIAVGVIWRRGRILVGRRRADQMLGGLWEFPGGKRRPGESLAETARREILEETGLEVVLDETPYAVVEHTYSHFRITLTAFPCRSDRGRPVARSTDALRWVRLPDLSALPFPKANLAVIDAIRRAHGASAVVGGIDAAR